jgi:hypothetical protein
LEDSEQGQRFRRENQFGELKSGPRFRASDFRPGLTPPVDPKAIPSYDVQLDNGETATVPATELRPVLRLDPGSIAREGEANPPKTHASTSRGECKSAIRSWAARHRLSIASLTVVVAGAWVGTAVPSVRAWAETNNIVLTLLIALVSAIGTVAALFR